MNLRRRKDLPPEQERTGTAAADQRKAALFMFAQKTIVLLLSLWIGAYGFLFTRNQGIILRIVSAVAWFLLPCTAGFRILAEKPLFPARMRKAVPVLAAAIGLACILFSLNNSSIGIWRETLAGSPSAPVWGYARIIRGDEWAVWTPFLYSQAAGGYAGVNSAIGAGSVDPAVIAIGGLPAWNLAAIFKPMYWGFLLLGVERGYSVLFLLRVVLLFFVSCRCALRYTGGSRMWSLTAAALITLSPYVQWWFSQSIAEVLIFSQAAVLCWIRALEAETEGKRFGFGSLSAWCFGCFIMVLYPAWLIPVGYLMLAVIIRQSILKRKVLRPASWLRILCPYLLAGGLLAVTALNSREAIQRIMNSVYPGQRIYTGGEVPVNFFSGLYPLTFPAKGPSNASEFSNFLSFAPAGILLAADRLFRKKQKDPFSIILLVITAVFTVLCFVSLPVWLAKATLLSQCSRPAFIVSLCSLLLLIRCLSLSAKEKTLPAERPAGSAGRICIALACAVLTTLLTWRTFHPEPLLTALLAVVSAGVFLLVFSGRFHRFTALVLCLLALISGAFVNPVQQGISEVKELPPVRLVESLSPSPDTVLAVEADWPVPNALLFSGARVLNSTQPYADPEKWRAADPEQQWIDVYNRLCHVSLRVSDKTSFELITADHIRAELTREDLKALGVHWLVTQNTCDDLEEIGSDGNWNVYRLQ